jgi:hypothetical protein
MHVLPAATCACRRSSVMTRLTFCTTGILIRRLMVDPQLANVSHVIIDEVHERGLEVRRWGSGCLFSIFHALQCESVIIGEVHERGLEVRLLRSKGIQGRHLLQQHCSPSTAQEDLPLAAMPGVASKSRRYYLQLCMPHLLEAQTVAAYLLPRAHRHCTGGLPACGDAHARCCAA